MLHLMLLLSSMMVYAHPEVDVESSSGDSQSDFENGFDDTHGDVMQTYGFQDAFSMYRTRKKYCNSSPPHTPIQCWKHE